MQLVTAQQPIHSTCPYCGVGCGVTVTENEAGLQLSGDAQHPANFGRLCSKGAALADTLDHEGRLLYPQVNGQRTSWDEALDLVANGFKEIRYWEGQCEEEL